MEQETHEHYPVDSHDHPGDHHDHPHHHDHGHGHGHDHHHNDPPPPRWRWPVFVAWVVAALALGALARSVVIVDQAEAVFITEFGRPVRLLDAPGLHAKWPWQSRRGFDKRLQLDAPP